MDHRTPDSLDPTESICVCGRSFDAEEIGLVRSLSDRFPGLSRNELALTFCELVDWHRPSGKPKSRECLDLFHLLEKTGVCRFPPKKRTRPRGAPVRVPTTAGAFSEEEICCDLHSLQPVRLAQVDGSHEHEVWRELVGRFHYLGYRMAFGAALRLFIRDKDGRYLGCLQYSSPAWRIKARDDWIGWPDDVRRVNLQRIVNQSRFLILPWVQVPNLSSHVLAKSVRDLPRLWRQQFAITPVLVETMVDLSRYSGTCYRAANWICAGETSGRGRMDRQHRRHGAEVKRLYLFPLVKDARNALLDVGVRSRKPSLAEDHDRQTSLNLETAVERCDP